jgi:hypothetical protein
MIQRLGDVTETLWTSTEPHQRLGFGWLFPGTPVTELQEAAELACMPLTEACGGLQLMYEVQAEQRAQFAQLADGCGLDITIIQQRRRACPPSVGQPGQDGRRPPAQRSRTLDQSGQALAVIAGQTGATLRNYHRPGRGARCIILRDDRSICYRDATRDADIKLWMTGYDQDPAVSEFSDGNTTSSRSRTCQTDSVQLDDQPGHDSRPAEALVAQLMSLAEEAVAQAAASFTVDAASLRARVRIALFCPSLNREQSIRLVAEEQAEALRKGRDAIASLFISEIDNHSIDLAESNLVRLSSDTGCLISSAAHYLQSARPKSAHFGLEDPISRRLIAYASVSRQDWDVIIDALRAINGEEAELFSLSRIYASAAAPRNTVSRLLALLIREYSAVGRNIVMSTTVDPNLGFRGTSYRAANWIETFSIPHLGYLYVDGQFCTRRQLIRTFGSDNPGRLVDLLGARFQMSGPLQHDTLVFVTATDRSLRHALREVRPQRLERK